MKYLGKNTMNFFLFLLWLGLGLSLTTARADEAKRYTIGDNGTSGPLFLVLPSREGVQ